MTVFSVVALLMINGVLVGAAKSAPAPALTVEAPLTSSRPETVTH